MLVVLFLNKPQKYEINMNLNKSKFMEYGFY